MKYAKFLMALAVACIIIMPAFSMPYNGQDDNQNKWNSNPMMGYNDKDNQCNCQEQCSCQKSSGQYDNHEMWDGKEKQNNCQNSMWQDNKQPCQKSMMGQDGEENKWDGKQNNQCGCQNLLGKDGKQMEKRPMKSMMEKMGRDGNCMCHRPIKSMMGHHDGIKAVIVTVKIIE